MDPFLRYFSDSELNFDSKELEVQPNLNSNYLTELAVDDLQTFLKKGIDNHNFGLEENSTLSVIGKMFGVLVVKTADNQIGYLAAFSGKLGGSNQHPNFVPPVFDMLTEDSFLNVGMAELNLLNDSVKNLKKNSREKNDDIQALTNRRKALSKSLQNQLFDSYIFINHSGVEKSLNKIFQEASYKNPPAGAGECAAPKLLQYAFMNSMKPLALAEFWWGLSPKSATWKHRHFYPSCKEKCEPILRFMLGDSSTFSKSLSFR